MEAMRRIRWASTLWASGWMVVGAFLVFGAMGLIGPIHFGKDAPAWVQAIGSIAAILVAIAVPYVQRKAELRETRRAELLKARSLGAALLRDIKKFRNHLEFVCSEIQARPDEPVDISPEMIPEYLWEHMDRLYELGEAGSDLIDAISMNYQARDMVIDGFLLPEEIPPYFEQVKGALHHCKKSIRGIEQML